ncbi:MAG: DUF5822 domain-containing protein [Halobacteriales archaeon]
MDGVDGPPVDHTRILQTTFVVTVLVGAPLVALSSLLVDLPTWRARAAFAGVVGGSIWLLTAIGLLVRSRRRG